MNRNICRGEGEGEGGKHEKYYDASYSVKPIAAFDIDSMCSDGRVAMIYKEGRLNLRLVLRLTSTSAPQHMRILQFGSKIFLVDGGL